MHIPDDPLFYEKFYFTPGDLGFPTFSTPFGRISVLICWDQWYPERPRGRSARRRLWSSTLPPSAGTRSRKSSAARPSSTPGRTMQRAHSIANGVYVAAANRVASKDRAGPRHRVLGLLLRRRSLRPGDRRSQRYRRSHPDRRVRSPPHRRGPPQLALHPRPAASTPTPRC